MFGFVADNERFTDWRDMELGDIKVIKAVAAEDEKGEEAKKAGSGNHVESALTTSLDRHR